MSHLVSFHYTTLYVTLYVKPDEKGGGGRADDGRKCDPYPVGDPGKGPRCLYYFFKIPVNPSTRSVRKRQKGFEGNSGGGVLSGRRGNSYGL